MSITVIKIGSNVNFMKKYPVRASTRGHLMNKTPIKDKKMPEKAFLYTEVNVNTI